jgi:3-hydroxyacyl-CoA dehydrogenase/3-hydroxy-2-methylbutyryl-CoA dehydrogenase
MQSVDAVVLITGGASGLGAGFARTVVQKGGRVGILDLPSSAGQAVAAGLGESAQFLPADITVEQEVERAVATLVERFGRIDVCVNAAGVSPAERVLTRDGDPRPLDGFRRTVEINLVGTFDVLRRAASAMTRNNPGADGERGLIVNVSSVAGLEGQEAQSAYSASKGGVVALTLPLAREFAFWGIRVLTICPGVMDTPMLAGVSAERRAALAQLQVFPKRLGTPDDFAHLVVTCMENTMLNGDVIRLDSGTRL